MIVVYAETTTETLKLRDAFRVMAWQHWQPHRKNAELNECYTSFSSRWNRCSIRSMDLTQLTELATKKGFTNGQLLLIREIYYGIHKPLVN